MQTPLRPSLYSNTVDHRPRLTRLFEAWVLKSWWVIVFCLGCYAAHERSSLLFHREDERLSSHRTELQQRRARLLNAQRDLHRKVNSQSDPAWIEQTLIKVLGLVPEGQTKVYFSDAIPAVPSTSGRR